ncbi:hypothetical protein NKW53_05925 [Acetobacter orientalis]|uniref:hypothetical protein n=1 Tax=Acetobacter orientalis TaxID=146474 RepID=UPI0020A1CFD1|nr:hypothetical protein [Acetobacter orientalis]MCP1215604.1 hypothetical protein [Acetobacter orientalis]MCP1217543.1 hypothetical protein [Acetobacter orientalis]
MTSDLPSSPYCPQDPLVYDLAQALRRVREVALEARASIAAVPEVIAGFEAQVTSAVQAEERLLAAIRAVNPQDADILAKVPVGRSGNGASALRLGLQFSGLVEKVARGESVLRPRPLAPPTAISSAALSPQELQELSGE